MATRKTTTHAKKTDAKKKPAATAKKAKRGAKKSAKKSSTKSAKKSAKKAATKSSAKGAASKKATKAKKAKGASARGSGNATGGSRAKKANKAKKSTARAAAAKPKKSRRAASAQPTRAAIDTTPLYSEGSEGFGARSRGIARTTPPRRTRETTLPPDHEVLSPGPLRGSPVDKDVVIEAVKAALQAVEEHPIKGTEFLGRRTRADLPREGEKDYAIAQEAQKAARELLAADDAAREDQRAVDERIAQVYASEAASFEQEDDE